MRIWDTQIKFWRNISLSLIFPRERKVTKNIAFNQLGSRSMSWIVNFSLPDGHPGAERSFLSDYPLKLSSRDSASSLFVFLPNPEAFFRSFHVFRG